MSHSLFGEEKIQAGIDVPRGCPSCRIPQRLPVSRQARVGVTTKAVNQQDIVRTKYDVATVQHTTRFGPKYTSRPRSDESRPKSTSRVKDELQSKQHGQPRSARPERVLSTPRKPSTIPKRVLDKYDNISGQSKARPISITVPLTQETIKLREEFDVKDASQLLVFEGESVGSRGDKAVQLKLAWQDKMTRFENMKSDLHERQRAIMELYATMRSTHQKMTSLGQNSSLPPADDLRIMNVSKMTPNQLLQLCARSVLPDDSAQHKGSQKGLPIDMNKLYNMPTKLFATCENTLVKRKEIIDWFETLKSEEKGISMNKLTKKINEFITENEMLNNSLQILKQEFLKDLNDVVDYFRNGMDETIALQLRTEELTYELSELNSQNADLRKQIHNNENLKSTNTKHRIEELEKELKDEKCKKMLMKDRLSRAEGQVKIGSERVSQLEATLEQSRSNGWALERTVKQLHDQNLKLQSDFEKELNKLTESIKEHTEHLEEITDAREKFQIEKEDLEKKLQELSEHYNEALKNNKHDLQLNFAKLVETEQKYNEEREEKIKMEAKIESFCAQLLESELRYKDTMKELREKEQQLNKAKHYKTDLEAAHRELELANIEIEECRNRLDKQGETIREIELNFKETIELENNLKCELSTKDEYIDELEKKQTLLEQQLQESETKMESYEQQLGSLKHQISLLQEEFGEFENTNELHKMVSNQRAKLLEATRQNGELAEALQKKDLELEKQLEHIAEQEDILEQKDAVLKMLTEKEDEQTKIIKLLRNNLEMRAQADNDIRQQVSDKNSEVSALVAKLESRKQQISELEKIILTLEKQLLKMNSIRRKDEEKNYFLERSIRDYEAYHIGNNRSNESPTENLDNLIKILENELGSPCDTRHEYRSSKDRQYNTTSHKKKHIEDYKRNKHEKSEPQEESVYKREHDLPTKIVMGNFVKKTYMTSNKEKYKEEKLDRKKAITNIETQKWLPAPQSSINVYTAPSVNEKLAFYKGMAPLEQPNDNYLKRNLQFLLSNQVRDEKNCKMFKFAGHKL